MDKLNEKIFAAAAELFLQRGFDRASMDAIAEKARISKRTLYSRHHDKSTLFDGVIYDLLGRLLGPVEKFRYDPSAKLDSVLLTLARVIGSTLNPEFLALHRVITFEAQRRPEFGRWITGARRTPVIHVIAGILQRYRDELRVNDFAIAAEQFSNLVFDSCLRRASFGIEVSPDDIDERISAAVDLFLSGVRRRGMGVSFIAAREKSVDVASRELREINAPFSALQLKDCEQ